MSKLQELLNDIKAQKEAVLKPDNLRAGVSLFGVNGVMVQNITYQNLDYFTINVEKMQRSYSVTPRVHEEVMHYSGGVERHLSIYPPEVRDEDEYYYIEGGCAPAFIQAICGVNNADMQFVNNMALAFCGCNNLVNASFTNTDQITNFAGTFYDCENLVDIQGLNYNNSESMSYTFSNCKSLQNINVVSHNAINWSNMVTNCTNLETLYVELPNVTNREIRTPIYNCERLTDVTVILDNAISIDGLFSYCNNIVNLNVYAPNALNASSAFAGIPISTIFNSNLSMSSLQNGYAMFPRQQFNNLQDVEVAYGIINEKVPLSTLSNSMIFLNSSVNYLDNPSMQQMNTIRPNWYYMMYASNFYSHVNMFMNDTTYNTAYTYASSKGLEINTMNVLSNNCRNMFASANISYLNHLYVNTNYAYAMFAGFNGNVSDFMITNVLNGNGYAYDMFYTSNGNFSNGRVYINQLNWACEYFRGNMQNIQFNGYFTNYMFSYASNAVINGMQTNSYNADYMYNSLNNVAITGLYHNSYNLLYGFSNCKNADLHDSRVNCYFANYLFNGSNFTNINIYNMSINCQFWPYMFNGCNTSNVIAINAMIDLLLNSTVINSYCKNIRNTNSYSPFAGSNINNVMYASRWDELRAKGYSY